jgi:uncharacterized protein involved in type VI secretion and phage assembly
MADKHYTQEGHRLKINTAYDRMETTDPFLLIQAHGKEYLSRPFQYDVTMWRPKSKGHVFGHDLINTNAKFGIRVSKTSWQEIMTVNGPQWKAADTKTSYVTRCGVFKSLAFEGTQGENFYQYSGVLVPTFKMMDYETCFRVYEGKSVVDIISDIVKQFSSIKVDLSQIKGGEFPRMDYCVQFGETTFNFLSRLMAQFGIWYYFDHNPDTWDNTMVLGHSQVSFKKCRINEGEIKDLPVDGLALRERSTLLSIADFNYIWIPAPRRVRVGDFNIMAPRTAIGAVADIDPARDLIQPQPTWTKSPRKPPTDFDQFRTEVFPVPLASNSDAKSDANIRMWTSESETITVKGGVRSPAFLPGHQFRIVARLPSELAPPGKDDKDTPDIREMHPLGPRPPLPPAGDEPKFVLTYNEFWCSENAYMPGKDFWSTLMKRLFGIGTDDPTTGLDIAAAFTAQGLNNYLQNELPYIMQNMWYPQTQNTGPVAGYSAPNPNPANPNVTVPYFIPYSVGGGLAAVTAILPGLVKTIEDILEAPKDDFHNSFTAIPLDFDGLHAPRSVPVPNDGQKRTAGGPHLATVIGKDGTQKGNGTEVYADAIGRVRIRFPWQWMGEPTDPWKWGSDLTTCWVRVSQAWAGHGFGFQFLPRIGDEVVVEFIGGDPDRPLITGRVYNADRGPTNMPFPAANSVGKALAGVAALPSTASSALPLSGIETRSTLVPVDENGSPPAKLGYHLLRFDDTYGGEQLLLRSQGRLDVTGKNSTYQTTEGNEHVLCIAGKDKQGKPVGGSMYMTTGWSQFGNDPAGEYDLHVGGKRREQVELGYQLRVKKDTELDLKGNAVGVVGGKLSLSATEIVLQASQKITLKVGKTTLVMNSEGHYFDAGAIKKQVGGPAGTASGLSSWTITDASKADPGDPPSKGRGPAHDSDDPTKGGRGGEQSGNQPVPPRSAPNWSSDGGNKLSVPLDELARADGGGG